MRRVSRLLFVVAILILSFACNLALVWSPVNARQHILMLIDGVEQTLDIEVEEMQDQEIADHLVEAAKRGVTVRVVMSPSPGVSSQ